jgi:serine/threonine protein phosphatase 1
MSPHATDPNPPSTGGRLVYAVGDVHGHAEELGALLRRIAADAQASRAAQQPLLIFLGDYVDRGPDSRGVIDAVLAVEAAGEFEVVALKGNHEDALIRFLADPSYAETWIANWGEATLRAYGVESWGGEAVQARFQAALPDAHRRFLGRLALSHTVGDYHFVHAGVRPGVAVEAQDERDLLWIRHEFLSSDAAFGKVVVHGHTPAYAPEVRANRIGVDTGCYFTGVLTAARLHGRARDFIQVRR